VVAVLLILFLLLGQLGLSPASALAAEPVSNDTGRPQEIFKDVPQANPNSIFINYLNKRGLLKGFPNGTFQPAAGLTRAEAAAVLVKAAGLKTGPAQAVFKDIKSQHWAAASIAAAKAAGLITGYPDGTFRPEAKLTRAEGITLILKLSKQPDNGAELPALADVPAQHWAVRPIATGLASEMIGLSTDNKHFLPNAVLTRGSLARALAILLTKDPSLYETSLSNRLTVNTGPVTVVRTGGTTSEAVTGSTELHPGDTVNTGSSGQADITFPDGTGLRLEGGSQFTLKEARGRSYIKPDGTPGTAVEWLALDLKNGKMFGALATNAGTSDNVSNNKGSSDNAAGEKAAFAQARTMSLGNLSENLVRTAAAAAKPLPWWQQSGTKRTKVKIDMPTGVAAIRGTFWENKVNPDGSFDTTLLTGSAEITAGGQTVDLSGGQRTEVTAAGAPPAPPAPMSTEDKKEWVALKTWVQERAAEIQTQQEQTLPPAPPAEAPEKPQQQNQNQNPTTDSPKLPSTDIISTINTALDSAGLNGENPTPSSGDGGDGGGGETIHVAGVYLNTPSIGLTVGDSPVTVTAHVYPDNATNKALIWTSDNHAAATVVDGVITPKAAGHAKITATTVDGEFSAYCIVYVVGPGGGDTTPPPPPQATFRLKSVEIASISSDEIQANNGSGDESLSLSQDGRYAAFSSYADNLVPGDENGQVDIFVRDRISGTTVRVSVDSDGKEDYSGSSSAPAISANGRYVVFASDASNLVAGDTNNRQDVFLHDRDVDGDGTYDEAGDISTVRVSIATGGTQADKDSFAPDISADGRFITFYSSATNLVIGDNNEIDDVFVHDMQGCITQRVSISTGEDGDEANAASYYPSISPNGRYVAFTSDATTLVPGVDSDGIFVRDLNTNTTSFLIPHAYYPDLSYDGRFVAYSAGNDIFVRDRDKNAAGVFDQVYEDTKVTVTIDGNPANDHSYQPSISGDGRYVAYTSYASNLVLNDDNDETDIFMWDSSSGTKRVSVPLMGWEADSMSWFQALSADGSSVAFISEATNLVPGDANYRSDVFVVSLNLDSPPDNIPPTSPTGLRKVHAGSTWAGLAWNPATDNYNVTRYSIYRSPIASGPFSEVASVSGYVYSYWDEDLSLATTYYYYVQAQDDDGNLSPDSATISISTEEASELIPLVTPVAAGYNYSLARLADGSAWAWGENSYGNLGNSTSSDSTTPQQTVFDAAYLMDVSALDAFNHTLAVKNDGSVWAWGDNYYGQLGIAADKDVHPTPIQVPGLTDIKAVAAGGYHSLALESDGTVWSWGGNYDGQLGNRFTNYGYYEEWHTTPMRVVSPDGTGFLTDVIAITASSSTSVALRANGTVWTWGSNSSGGLGIGTNDNDLHPVPVQVPGLADIVAISGSNDHYMALRNDGTVWTWGDNYYGQLGDNTTLNRNSPVQVVIDPEVASEYLTGVIAIAAGLSHSVALKADGTVWTWGDNNYYQLGDGTLNYYHSPVPIQVVGPSGEGNLLGISAIAADGNHTLAFKSDGTIWAWGANYSGQLGDGTTNDSSSPIQVQFPEMLADWE
jgi:alpha-tubulin suppressor-like RCC1 family protein